MLRVVVKTQETVPCNGAEMGVWVRTFEIENEGDIAELEEYMKDQPSYGMRRICGTEIRTEADSEGGGT